MESVAVDTSRSGVSDQIRKATRRARPWAFLSPELLADVCARLHDAADFVRFHAVCAPWRDAAPSMRSPEAPAHTFLPWLVSQSSRRIIHSPVIYSGQRVSSEPKPNHRRCGYNGVVLREPGALSSWSDTNLVGSADGRSAWIFVGDTERTTLFDLVTREVTLLPPFRMDEQEIDRPMSNPPGIVYSDGTRFLYTFEPVTSARHRTTFKSAILRPGDAAWTVVEARLDIPAVYHSCAAYHGGKVLVWVGAYFWCVVTPDFEASSTQIINGVLETTWDRLEDEYYERDHSYVLESRGELLWASILVEKRNDYNARYYMSPTLSMRVHVLEEEADGSGKMHWVEKDDRSLGDRVLFLGSPASFAANAAELGVDGGCAYFVFRSCVFRYSFIDGEAKQVEWMCPGRGSSKARLWLRPQQPRIASVQEIRERLASQNTKKPN